MSKKKVKKRRGPGKAAKTSSQSVQHSGESKTLIWYYAAIIGFALSYKFISNQPWFFEFAGPIFNGYAAIGSDIINLFGYETNAAAEVIGSTEFSLRIKEGCDGIMPMLLYTMSILAFPISMKYKWQGVIIGLVFLFVMNVLRIVSLYFVGVHFEYAVFDFMHVDFWSILYLVLAIASWFIWMRWTFIRKKSIVSIGAHA